MMGRMDQCISTAAQAFWRCYEREQIQDLFQRDGGDRGSARHGLDDHGGRGTLAGMDADGVEPETAHPRFAPGGEPGADSSTSVAAGELEGNPIKAWPFLYLGE